MRKGGKVSKEQNNEGKRHRSTQQELCIKYNKERSKLYRERKKLKVLIGSGVLDGKALNNSNQKLLSLNYKVEGYTSKLFKCGKRYAKLKSKKRKLINRKNYLVKILKDAEVGSKEHKKNLSELMLVVSKINDLEYSMKLRILGTKDGELQIGDIEVPSVTNVDSIGFWELNTLISDTILSGRFKVAYLDGQSFDLKTSSFLLQEKSRFIVREMTKERAEGKRLGTPMVMVESNFSTLEIKITTGL